MYLSSPVQVIARLQHALAHHGVEGHADALPTAGVQVLRQVARPDGLAVGVRDESSVAILVEPEPPPPLEVRPREWRTAAQQPRLAADLDAQPGRIAGVQDVVEAQADHLGGGQPSVEEKPYELLLAHAEGFAVEQGA